MEIASDCKSDTLAENIGGSNPSPPTKNKIDMAVWYKGYYVGLSLRRYGFKSRCSRKAIKNKWKTSGISENRGSIMHNTFSTLSG